MRDYNAVLAERLAQKGREIIVRGVTVEVKPVPDGDGTSSLDPRTLRIEESMMAAMEAAASMPPLDLAGQRDQMGGANYNLNRTEIYTRYLEIPTSAGVVPVWGYYPRRMQGQRPAMIYIHGGGFFGGSVFAVENPMRLLAERADCSVWNVDYSLPPEHPYPIPTTQIYEVAVWLRKNAASFGIDPNRIAIAGDSAGGNMAAAVTQMDRDRGTGLFKAHALLYAKLTFTNTELPGYSRDESAFEIVPEQAKFLPGLLRIGSEPSNAHDEQMYLQGRYPLTDPYISPAFGKKEGLPRALILLAEYDGLRLEGEFYASQLQAAGVPVRVVRYRGIGHGFLDLLGILPQAEAAVEEMAALLKDL